MTFAARYLVSFAAMYLAAWPASAGEADVVDVKFDRNGATFTFHVTVAHGDTGWDHYADRWEVVGPDGTVLATRVLAHPHVNEQPFTRSQSGIEIPQGIRSVTVRAHDSVDGYGGNEMIVELSDGTGG